MSFLFFKQKTAYEMRISDWSSDVCSSDLNEKFLDELHERFPESRDYIVQATDDMESPIPGMLLKDYIAAGSSKEYKDYAFFATNPDKRIGVPAGQIEDAKRVYEEKYPLRSEEHTSELQSLMRISYAVFCLKKKKIN